MDGGLTYVQLQGKYSRIGDSSISDYYPQDTDFEPERFIMGNLDVLFLHLCMLNVSVRLALFHKSNA